MKLYVVLATLLISVACKGAAHSVPSYDNFFTRLCSNDARRQYLYTCDPAKNFAFYRDEDLKKHNIIYYHHHPEPSYTLDVHGHSKERLCYQHKKLKDGHIYSVKVVVAQPDGTQICTTWKDKWVTRWFIADKIEPQGRTTEVIAAPTKPVVVPTVQPMVSQQAPQASSFFTTKRLVVGALLASAALVYRYREPIKKTLAKLAQGAQKVKAIAQ